MIITLKGADFSNSNVGTLSTWLITKSLKGVTTDNTLTSIDKENSGYTAVFVVNDGYTLSTAKVTMGGVDITSSLIWSDDETSAILTISEVTGNVVISIVAVSESGEDEISYTYELGKSIRTADGTILEGDTYAHLTLMTIPQVDRTKSLMMRLTNSYSYKVFYYKGDTFVAAMDSNYEEVSSNTSVGSWLLINGYNAADFDTIRVIYKETAGSATTTPAKSPTDIGLELSYKYAGEYELGWSLQSTYGYFLYDKDTNKYSHITTFKPVAYNDNLKFSINDGYAWAIYAFDSNMNYLGTHDGATTSPWEQATSDYAVNQVKTLWNEVAYVTAAFKVTDGASGDSAVIPSVAGANFYE